MAGGKEVNDKRISSWKRRTKGQKAHNELERNVRREKM